MAAPRRPGTGAVGLVAFVALCNGAGLASALIATQPEFYSTLVRPSWAPPPVVFGPVWTVLYTLMGIATWLVWRSDDPPARRRALVAFAAQLVLNVAWSPVFFGLHEVGAAVFVIVAVLVAVIVMWLEYRRVSAAAAWLVAPLAGWVAFATALNVAIWWLQRG
ncbi:MAG: TspO/MBR family protein [Kofleriaceae bacterium]